MGGMGKGEEYAALGDVQLQSLRFHPDEFAFGGCRQHERYDVLPDALGDHGKFLALPEEKHGLVVGLEPVWKAFRSRGHDARTARPTNNMTEFASFVMGPG
jgi:hypothetical protein